MTKTTLNIIGSSILAGIILGLVGNLVGAIELSQSVPFNPGNPQAVYQLQPTVSGESLQYGADVTRESVTLLKVL